MILFVFLLIHGGDKLVDMIFFGIDKLLCDVVVFLYMYAINMIIFNRRSMVSSRC